MLATVSLASLGRTELRLEMNCGGRRSTTSSLRRSLQRRTVKTRLFIFRKFLKSTVTKKLTFYEHKKVMDHDSTKQNKIDKDRRTKNKMTQNQE